MHHPPPSVKDTIPASSPKAILRGVTRSGQKVPTCWHVASSLASLPWYRGARRHAPLPLSFHMTKRFLLASRPRRRWHNDCSSCWCTGRESPRCLGHAIDGVSTCQRYFLGATPPRLTSRSSYS